MEGFTLGRNWCVLRTRIQYLNAFSSFLQINRCMTLITVLALHTHQLHTERFMTADPQSSIFDIKTRLIHCNMD